jgi:hypothetical protein
MSRRALAGRRLARLSRTGRAAPQRRLLALPLGGRRLRPRRRQPRSRPRRSRRDRALLGRGAAPVRAWRPPRPRQSYLRSDGLALFVPRVWESLWGLRPELVGGCRPLRLTDHFEPRVWRFAITRSSPASPSVRNRRGCRPVVLKIRGLGSQAPAPAISRAGSARDGWTPLVVLTPRPATEAADLQPFYAEMVALAAGCGINADGLGDRRSSAP